MSENKGDLISQKAAIQICENQCVDGNMFGNEQTEGTLVDVSNIIDEISNLPAVDAVEVVRCRDCKSSRSMNEKEQKILCDEVVICERAKEPMWPDDFCSYGERKDGVDNGKLTA